MCINNALLFLAYQSINWWQNSVHILLKLNYDSPISLHISATLHLTIVAIRSNNIQSVQYVICVVIVRELLYIGLAIRYTIWIVAHLCTLRASFCVLTVKWHCLHLTRLPRVAGGAPAVNHKATARWLAFRILAGNEHCNMCDGNPVSEYIFNFFYGYLWMNASKIWLSYLLVFVLYPCQILKAYKP